MALHISISAETITHLGPIPVTNSMITSVLVSGVLVLLALFINSSLKKTGKPSRFQSMIEMILEGIYNLAVDITGSRKKASKFFPLVMTFFLFILMNNWFGLLPGVGTIGFTEKEESAESVQAPTSFMASTAVVAPRNEEPITQQEKETAEAKEDSAHTEETVEKKEEGSHAGGKFVPYLRAGTADLNTTIALAIISVVATQYFGFQALGAGYLKKYFNFSSPIMFFVGILELILETAKIMSFAFRLFGNIFAGEVLLAVMLFLAPLVVPMPFYGLEIFVGMIQALVFSMLTLVFFNLATVGHGDEH